MIPFPDKKYDVIHAGSPWEGGFKLYSTLSPHIH